jgi:uncharacterized protein (TIGR03067 family)
MRTGPSVAVSILLLSLAGTVVAQTAAERLQREEEKLAGAWRVTAVHVNGMILPSKQVPDLQLTFKNGRFTARLGKDKPQEGTYKLDPSKKPRTIDLERTSGPDKGKKQVGIYELTGNTLRICACEADNDRPTDFDTNDKPGYTVLILKRLP